MTPCGHLRQEVPGTTRVMPCAVPTCHAGAPGAAGLQTVYQRGAPYPQANMTDVVVNWGRFKAETGLGVIYLWANEDGQIAPEVTEAA